MSPARSKPTKPTTKPTTKLTAKATRKTATSKRASRPATEPSRRNSADQAAVESISLRGGQAWSRRLRRGQVLRIVDTDGRACVSALFFNTREPMERYNMADTLKAQYTAFLTEGRVLYSDMGRILVSVIGDTCGWHDTISGCGDPASSDAQFGPGSYQHLRNDFFRNARDNFVIELGKYGMGKRDIVANLNFFVRVSADDDGRIAWVGGNSQAGAHVDLRAEMDTLVVLSNTPHPLDPSPTYDPPPVELSIREASAAERPGPDDPCRLSRAENARGFALTEAYVREVEAASSLPERRVAS